MTHTKSPVIQTNDYYPFGLTFNSYQRENSTPNKFKFQGQEHVDDLGLNWDSFKWRNHQPDIGRFFNVDPLAEKYYYNSPYAFSENKVIAHVELEGLEAETIKQIEKQVTDKENWSELGHGMKQFGNGFLQNTGLKALWGIITNVEASIPHEDDKPADVDGRTVTIVGDGAPNEEYLPNGGDDDNSVIEQSFINALGIIPGRRFEGSRTTIGAGRLEAGETMSEVTGSGVDAYSAGKDAFEKPAEGDTLFHDANKPPPLVGEQGQRTKAISDTSSVIMKVY